MKNNILEFRTPKSAVIDYYDYEDYYSLLDEVEEGEQLYVYNNKFPKEYLEDHTNDNLKKSAQGN